jgi:hypothetical protein
MALAQNAHHFVFDTINRSKEKKRRIMNNGTLEQGREGSLERESLEILHGGEQLAGGRHEKG